mgnify:CR=1 FL=1|jgi:hypothetical protein
MVYDGHITKFSIGVKKISYIKSYVNDHHDHHPPLIPDAKEGEHA